MLRTSRDGGPTVDAANPTSLPPQLTSFVGRERELTDLTRLLGRTRLVTLTGAGGVGKTRLALSLAEQLGATFADGVAFVDLAPVVESDGLIPAIARSLGIRDDGELSVAQRLENALHDRELLLVLDNFEQVLAAAPLVPRLLQAAARLSVVVTSRGGVCAGGARTWSATAGPGFVAPHRYGHHPLSDRDSS
jgi:predicted ATPase